MQGWYANSIEEADVRSVFLIRKRCLPLPFLQAFDLPDTTVSCARRDTTVVAPQALMLLNSEEGIRYAKALADRAARQEQTLDFDNEAITRNVINSLFQRALTRSATDEEQKLATEMLRRHRGEHAKKHGPSEASRRALIDLCRAVCNLSEFAYVD